MQETRKISKEELQRTLEAKEQLLESDFNEMTDEARERFSRFVMIAAPISIVVVTAVGITAWTLGARRARRQAAQIAIRGMVMRTVIVGGLLGLGALLRGRGPAVTRLECESPSPA